MMKKKFLLGGLILLILAGAGVFYYEKIKIPEDWKTYQDSKFGFEFRYPPSVKVCVFPQLHDEEKDYITSIGIAFDTETCEISQRTGINTSIKFDLNVLLAKVGDFKEIGTLDDDFYREFYGIERSDNPELKYTNLGGLRAYGGVATRKTSNGIRHEYILGIHQNGNNASFWDKNYDEHSSVTDAIIRSWKFDMSMYHR